MPAAPLGCEGGHPRDIQRDAGTRDDDHVREVEQRTPAMPFRQPEERVGADDEGERPRRVLAAFPMAFAFTLGPEDHFLPAPIPTTVPGDQPLAELCAHDLLVDAAQGNSVEPAASRLRQAGALAPLATFGPPRRAVTVYRVACPPGAAAGSR